MGACGLLYAPSLCCLLPVPQELLALLMRTSNTIGKQDDRAGKVAPPHISVAAVCGAAAREARLR